jgi:hypothetical protein
MTATSQLKCLEDVFQIMIRLYLDCGFIRLQEQLISMCCHTRLKLLLTLLKHFDNCLELFIRKHMSRIAQKLVLFLLDEDFARSQKRIHINLTRF